MLADACFQDDLRNGLRKRTYLNWKLQDIGIWVSGTEMDSDIMDLLATSIPSLRSFWGLGRVSHNVY